MSKSSNRKELPMKTEEMVRERKGALYTTYLFDDVRKWQHFVDKTFECRVLLCPEESGGYSAHAMRLPGVVSQGETEKEALENIADAFRASVESYTAGGVTIPWTDNPLCNDKPPGSTERWILVNA
jgi:predicted RNase H-like HicB family nuclease